MRFGRFMILSPPRLPSLQHLPSTSEVRRVTLAAFLRPAGRFSPIFSNLSRRIRPPFLLLALCERKLRVYYFVCVEEGGRERGRLKTVHGRKVK